MRSNKLLWAAAPFLTACVTPVRVMEYIRPECLVVSICSVASAQIAVFNPELTHPQEDANQGPGHALAANAPRLTTKQGEACAYTILGVFSWGDASIRAAVKDGGISRIVTVDYEKTAVLAFVYNEFCTRVAGNP